LRVLARGKRKLAALSRMKVFPVTLAPWIKR
jgi:hypothetical protein